MTKQSEEKVYVSESKIHGKGLFAKTNIASGEVIGVATGRKVKTNGDHVLWVTEEYGIRVTGAFQYVNHSEKPNACYYDTAELIATRKIKADEEITHNYECDEI